MNRWNDPYFLSLHKSPLFMKTDLLLLFIRSDYLNGEIFIITNGRIIDCRDLIILNHTEWGVCPWTRFCLLCQQIYWFGIREATER